MMRRRHQRRRSRPSTQDLDWTFIAQPNPHPNVRAMPLNMGKVLGGRSCINVMVRARAHRSDRDHFAHKAHDDAKG